MTAITRQQATVIVAIALNGNLSGEFDMRPYAMGLVHMPAAWTAASIGFKVASESGGTFLPLYDKNGSLVQVSSPAVDTAVAFPAEVAACKWVKLWSQDGSASNTAQAAARSLTVDLKG